MLERTCTKCIQPSKAAVWNGDLCPRCGFQNNDGQATATPDALATLVARDSKSGSKKVVVTDIKMPFESMVIFMVKWAFASIPAVIILGLVWMLLVGLVAA